MSLKIAVYKSGRFSHFIKPKDAARKSRRYRWISKTEVEEITLVLTAALLCAFYDGPLGVGNALPFARVQDKMRKPDKLHYEIPACGARSRPMYAADVNQIPELGA